MDSPNPATSFLAAALNEVRKAVDGVTATLERREKESPGLVRINEVFATSTRLRVVQWVVAVKNAGTFGVHVGSRDIVNIEAAGAGTFIVPLPLTIDRGVDISTSGTAADITDSFLIAFTE